jgi:flagellin
MSTRINTNVAALIASQNLNAASSTLSMSINRLSSGLRINSAADDPAGLDISQHFLAQISGITQATQNTNDATNLIKTAEGALNQVQSLIVGIRQLAVAASNQGVNSTTDIAADQTQITSALGSIDQIAETTQFGGKKLLDGTANANGVVRGGSATATSTDFNVVSKGTWASTVDYTNVTINAASAAKFTIATGGYNPSGGTQTQLSSTNTFFNGSITIDNKTYTLSSTAQNSLTNLNAAISSSGYTATIDGNNDLVLTSGKGGPQSGESVDASNLIVSGNAPVLLTGNSNVLDGSNTLMYQTVTGTGGNLPINLSSVNSSTAISVSGTISFNVTDPSSNVQSFKKTYAYGTNIDQVQKDLDAQFGTGNFQVQTDVSGDLAIVDNLNGSGDTITNTSANSDFVAYNTATVGLSTYANGKNATMTISDSTGKNTITSNAGVSDSGSVYYGFSNGLVLSSSITASLSGSTQLRGDIQTTKGSDTAGTALLFQIGANTGQSIAESLQSVVTDQLGMGTSTYVDANGSTQTPWATNLRDINVTTFKGAQDAIAIADKALEDISTMRANLGALQTNVLQANATSLQTANQNLSASLSTIRDVDLSTEIVTYTKAQILVQAGTSALGQANQAPQALLKLLQ